MLNDQRAITIASTSRGSHLQEDHHHHHHDHQDDQGSPIIRDIHALTPPPASRVPRREAWETSSHRSSSLSMASSTTEGGENFTSMSREFSALVLAGSTITEHDSGSNNLGRIGEEENSHEETNPLAIVPDSNPLDPVQSPRGGSTAGASGGDGLTLSTVVNGYHTGGEVTVQRVKKEEVESKINAWQNAKIAKINNRFKREDAIIKGWEGEQVQKANSWMKKVEVLDEFP